MLHLFFVFLLAPVVLICTVDGRHYSYLQRGVRFIMRCVSGGGASWYVVAVESLSPGHSLWRSGSGYWYSTMDPRRPPHMQGGRRTPLDIGCCFAVVLRRVRAGGFSAISLARLQLQHMCAFVRHIGHGFATWMLHCQTSCWDGFITCGCLQYLCMYDNDTFTHNGRQETHCV